MSQVFIISDLHLSHRRVIEFEDRYRAKVLGVETIEQHDEKICDLWNDTVKKRDVVKVLGDVGFGIDKLKGLPGRKELILGNHDEFPAIRYLEVFDDIIGPVKYKRYWLNHFPTIQDELYGKPVIHGHTHTKGINDSRYINVCIEMTEGYPIKFQDIKSGKYYTWHKVNMPLGTTTNIDLNPTLKSPKQ